MKTPQDYRVDKLNLYVGLLGRHVARGSVAPSEFYIHEPAPPTHNAPAADLPWREYSVGEHWGGKQQWAAFRALFAVPEQWHGKVVELRMRHRARWLEPPVGDNTPAGPEGQAFIDGERAGAIDGGHHSIRWGFQPGHCTDVRAIFFAGRAACRHEVEQMELALVDAAAERLYHDLRVAMDVAAELDAAAPARYRLWDAVDAAVRVLEQGDIGADSFYERIPQAQAAFDVEMASLQGAGAVPEIVCVGHAHIDLAWLWPASQTRHKCTRTFGTQCRLLEQYPEWSFLQSQAQAYAWVEQDAPELFERICELVEAGRWEVEGATWAEMDTNITGAESLVRQFLYGKRYFREKFGTDCQVLWLPDVFGYSAALPQILRLAGVTGFVTSKISWNQVNRFPHDTFRWRGIDGTEIPTHFITVPCSEWFYTYNAQMTVAELKGTWQEYRQKEVGTEPLMTFGYGDGGGGPTEKMLETAERLRTMPAIADVPRVKFGAVRELMARVGAQSDCLPVWDGELYLEYHRGTYTTQAWLKRANRRNEVRLHNAEWLAVLAGPYGYELDKAALDAAWEDLLLCQFHDILPGSSVGETYQEVRQMQQEIAHQADAMIGQACEALARRVDTASMVRPAVLLNTLGWDREDPFQLPDGSWRDDVAVPSGGWASVDGAERPEPAQSGPLSVSEDARHLENHFWSIRLDDEGRLAELHDRVNDRQVLAPGRVGNEWQVFAERPTEFDAWNIAPYYEEHPLPGPTCLGTRIVDQNDVRVAVETVWDLADGGSITQTLAIYANYPRIDFETVVDWRAQHQMLKAAFPLDIRATEATYQVQFGHVRRPTHRNTSWDWARYEACGHGFVDLSEHGYGVALLNDCKYGYDVRDNVMRITCLKSPTSPHGEADKGVHEFTYALLPHAGSLQEAQVVRRAAELNNPLLVVEAGAGEGDLPSTRGFVFCDNPAVVVETMKPAEDGDGMIVRCCESHGSHARAELRFAGSVDSVGTVDLLEEPLSEDVGLEHKDNSVLLQLRPFQIVSLRVRR